MKFDIQRLVAADDHLFEEVVLLLRRQGVRNPAELAECIDVLGANGFIGASERQARTFKLLKLLGPEPLFALQAWRLTSNKTPSTRGAIAAYVPASLKPEVLVDSESERSEAHQVLDTDEPSKGGQVPPPRIPDADIGYDERGSGALVVLLGDENEFSTTRALLSGSNFASVIRTNIREVDTSDLATACAVIVGKSRYQHLDTQDQVRLLREVVRSTGQAWIRFGADGLTADNLLDPICLIESLGFSKARAAGIRIAEHSGLTSTDLGFIRSHARQLDQSAESSLLVDGLTRQQGHLVAFAVRKQLSEAGLDHLLKPIINVQMLSGRSGAKVMAARVEGCHHPFILRLGKKDSLLEGQWAEIGKIKRLILPWKPGLLPSVYYVGDDAILVYASVTEAQDPQAVATTLAERLRQIQALEPPFPPDGLPNPEELDHAIEEAFKLLCGLNKTSVSGISETYRFTLHDYEMMVEQGRAIRIDTLSVPLEQLLQDALETINCVFYNAVNHGDPHTRNILLPANAHAELIDFERVHCGHPLYDTCQLAISIAATTYRSYGTFEELVAIFDVALFDHTVSSSHGLDPGSKVNQTVLQALISARKNAKSLAAHYGLMEKSFPAMLIVVSSMVLMYLPHLQSHVAKAVIVACKRRFDSLSNEAR